LVAAGGAARRRRRDDQRRWLVLRLPLVTGGRRRGELSTAPRAARRGRPGATRVPRQQVGARAAGGDGRRPARARV